MTTTRQAQIIAAALPLFDAHGYTHTSMEMIAQAIGTRASSLYNHFPHKQQILTEAVIGSMQDLLHDHAVAVDHAASPAKRLAQSMRLQVHFHCANAVGVRVHTRELKSLPDRERAILTQLKRDYRSRWQHIIDAGITAGQFTITHPRLITRTLLDLGAGPAQWFQADGPLATEVIAAEYLQIAYAMVGYEQPV